MKTALPVLALLASSCMEPASCAAFPAGAARQPGRPVIHVDTLGDSITRGLGVTTPWPSTLATTFAGLNGPMTVTNMGVDSDTTSGMLTRYQAAGRYQYNYLVLWGGTNDVNASSTGAQACTGNQNIIAAEPANTETFLLTPLPRCPFTSGQKTELQNLRTCLQGLASTHIHVVDMYPLFDDTNNEGCALASLIQADNVHPNQTGADLVASTLTPLIEAFGH